MRTGERAKSQGPADAQQEPHGLHADQRVHTMHRADGSAVTSSWLELNETMGGRQRQPDHHSVKKPIVWSCSICTGKILV